MLCFKATPNSINFYKGILLHVAPFRIIVRWLYTISFFFGFVALNRGTASKHLLTSVCLDLTYFNFFSINFFFFFFITTLISFKIMFHIFFFFGFSFFFCFESIWPLIFFCFSDNLTIISFSYLLFFNLGLSPRTSLLHLGVCSPLHPFCCWYLDFLIPQSLFVLLPQPCIVSPFIYYWFFQY